MHTTARYPGLKFTKRGETNVWMPDSQSDDGTTTHS